MLSAQAWKGPRKRFIHLCSLLHVLCSTATMLPFSCISVFSICVFFICLCQHTWLKMKNFHCRMKLSSLIGSIDNEVSRMIVWTNSGCSMVDIATSYCSCFILENVWWVYTRKSHPWNAVSHYQCPKNFCEVLYLADIRGPTGAVACRHSVKQLIVPRDECHFKWTNQP